MLSELGGKGGREKRTVNAASSQGMISRTVKSG